ncbi:Probable intracellular septation protein A [Buchnera aphidicola (Thelaxes suberi)]|uniref:inner membrane-spanning protein YciB n=1 Tax=Buchnera aphidicola TaxID=9 RepID=UPI003464CBC0
MKPIFHLLSLIVFFISYKFYGFMLASEILLLVTVMSFCANWYFFTINILDIINFFLILILSVLTMHIQNIELIKYKMSLFYILLSIGLIYSHLGTNNSFIKILISESRHLNEEIIKKINLAWMIFCVFCAILHAIVASFASDNLLMLFKIFVLTSLMIIFIGSNLIYVQYAKNNKINEKNQN